ncbi:MAG TPA: MFS transporter [Actinobacteria bacterium]|nr:MFS transporter [Actinomycetota bacterium]
MESTSSGSANSPSANLVSDQGAKAPRSYWFALAFISMGVTMVMIDATIVNVAIPQVTADLNLQPTDILWINSIYALVFAALLISMGKLADSIGRRLVFVLGVAIFVIASLIAALAPSGEVIIAGRAIQGVGGAMMITASLSLLNSMFRGKDRAIAFAIWGAMVGTVAALGPLLGGFLTSEYSWRWAFAINVPIAVVSIAGALALAPEAKDTTSKRGLDLPGVLLSALGLGALIFALIQGQVFGWWAPKNPDLAIGAISWPLTSISPVPVALLISVVSITAFVVVERRRASADKVYTLDLDLFKVRTFAWGNLTGLCIMFGEFGIILTLPIYLQNGLGFSALKAGCTTAFIMVGALLAAPASGRLTQAKGPMFVVRTGLLIEGLAMAAVGLTYAPDTSQWAYVPWLALFGVGVGLGTAPLVNVILRDVPVDKSGQASGTQSTSRQVGTALGVAILGAVLWTSLGSTLTADLQQPQVGLSAQEAQKVADSIVASSGVTINANAEAVPPQELIGATYGPAVQQAAEDAFARSTAAATYVGAGFVLLGLLATLGRTRRREDADGGANPADSSTGHASSGTTQRASSSTVSV